jgi:hypothetical protein
MDLQHEVAHLGVWDGFADANGICARGNAKNVLLKVH